MAENINNSNNDSDNSIDILDIVEELAMAINARNLAVYRHWVCELYECEQDLARHQAANANANADSEIIGNAERMVKRAKNRIAKNDAKRIACLEFLAKQTNGILNVQRLASRPAENY